MDSDNDGPYTNYNEGNLPMSSMNYSEDDNYLDQNGPELVANNLLGRGLISGHNENGY